MKTIILVLLLTASGLVAQTPATPNREEALRRALREAVSGKTNTSNPTALSPATPRVATPVTDANPNEPAANAPSVIETPPPAVVPSPVSPSVAAPVRPVPSVVPAVPVVTPANTPAPNPHAIPNPEEMIPTGMLNFTAAALEQVLTIYAEMVGRTVLRPSTLASSPIVLKAQTPLTRAEAVQALDAVLALNNIAMVNVGEKFVKAVPVTTANQEGAAFSRLDASQLPSLGSYVTHVVQLKYAKPTELQPVLAQFSKIPNSILPIDSSGIIVLRDITENVKRMLELIEKLDVTVESEFVSEVIPIKYAKAEDIASALNSVSSGGGGATVGAAASGTRTTGGARTTGGLGGAARPGTVGYNPSQPGQPAQLGGAAAGTPSSGASFSDRLQRIIQRASSTGSGDLQILGATKIIADVRSNSLLIFATRQDLTMIKDIVNKLDVVLAQVLIETLIMDVTIGDDWSFGVSAVQKPKDFSKDFAGAGGMNANKFFDFAGSSSTNAFGELLGSGIKYFGKVNEDILISVEAAASEGRLKVVQRPRIQTSHATPAALFIGSTVPYVTSTYYGGGYGGGPSSSYQQLEVGIRLNVTPFINQEGLVVMQIEETIAELDGSTKIEGVGDVPNTKNSTLSAEIAVRDGEAVILGGIVRNSDNLNKSGVPYLKDIPLLGYLFRSTTSAKKRQESIVLMRPTVLRTPELAAQQVALERQKMPAINEAAYSMRRDQIKAELKEAERLQKEQESDRALELKYKALEEKLLNTQDPVQP